jgi:hypothetical protein
VSEPLVSSWHKLEAVERFFVRSQIQGGSPEFSAEADFDGILDAEVMQRAVDSVLPMHPLLSSRVQQVAGHMTWQGVAAPNPFRHEHVNVLNKSHVGCSFLSPPQSVDLSVHSGLSVRLTTSANLRSKLRFEFHHACTDGQGGARFYRDVTMAYAALISGNTRHFSTDRDALAKRGLFDIPNGEQPTGLGEGLRNLWTTVSGKNHRIAPVCRSGETGRCPATDGQLVVQFVIDVRQTATIHDFLIRSKHVMNDVMLTATFMMLEKCTSPSSDKAFVNVLNPVDLRTWSDRRSSACNRVGFAYVRRRSSDWETPARLLRSVADQLSYVRKRGVAAELMKGVQGMEKVPLALRWIEQSGRFTPTATLTCLSNLQLGRRHGVRFEDGQWTLAGAKVDRVAGIAPLPAGVPLAITVTDANGSMAITMRAVRSHFDQDRLKHFGEVLCSNCEEICG